MRSLYIYIIQHHLHYAYKVLLQISNVITSKMYFCYVIVTIIFCLIYSVYIYVSTKYNYWWKEGIKGPRPIPVVGSFGTFMLSKESVDQLMKRIYYEFPEEKVVGVYRGFQPALLVRDLEFMKYMFVKDFNIFQDRGVRPNNNRFSNHLLASEGNTWRILRQKLSPIFTSGKIKAMIPLIKRCVKNYTEYTKMLIENNIEHEIRSLTGKYTLQVIGSCAFGLNINTFSGEENEFTKIAQFFSKPSLKLKIWQTLDMILPGIRKIFPKISQVTTEMEIFFVTLVTDIIKQREDKKFLRKDFMDLMIGLKEEGTAKRRKEDGIEEIDIDEVLIAAQAFLFYIAGFETSSGTMSFLLYELALHQDLQQKVFKEVCEACNKHNGELSYDSLLDMPYLEMVFDEVLRMHPVAGILVRKTSENYIFPGTKIKVEKGTTMYVSSSALHSDPKYFPYPNEFQPDRFSAENKKSIPHCAYMPFGEGPRNCIGMRFAKSQSLMGTAAFLRQFKVEPSAKTRQHLEYSPTGITLTSRDGIWLKISKR